MKRKKLWLSLLLLVVALLAAWFEPTRCVRGVLAGEPFHDGRPASYWAAEWEHWRIVPMAGAAEDVPMEYDRWTLVNTRDCAFYRQDMPTMWERFEKKLKAVFQPNVVAAPLLLIRLNAQPPLLSGDDPAALPVLQRLENDTSAKVRLFAKHGIQKLRDAQAP